MEHNERRYNVVVINERTGRKTVMNTDPLTHNEACTWVKKLTPYRWRRNQVEEVTN